MWNKLNNNKVVVEEPIKNNEKRKRNTGHWKNDGTKKLDPNAKRNFYKNNEKFF